MEQHFKNLEKYLHYLTIHYNLNICIKDFCGFVPINKELDKSLQPFLSHDNKFCMYIKSEKEIYHKCLSMIRKIYRKCEKSPKTFYGMCHAGLGEYVTPIVLSKGNLLGTVNIGFFSPGEHRTLFRINKTCSLSKSLSQTTAIQLYNSVPKARIKSDEIISIMEMLAEYLSFSYEAYLNTHCEKNAGRQYRSSENIILTRAISYLRQNFIFKITIDELANYCYCSTSYLSHIFKHRTGININTYLNKIRIEKSKEFLIASDLPISQIAINVGFNDPNYYSRVFTQLTGIPPKEFRHRFQYLD